jgi:hypothetical protein
MGTEYTINILILRICFDFVRSVLQIPVLVSDSTIVLCVSLYVVVVGLLHLDVCFVRDLLTEVLIVLDMCMYEFGRPHSSCASTRSIQNVVCCRELLRG